MTNRQYFIYAFFLVALILLCAAFWYRAFTDFGGPAKEKRVGEPLDVVFDYYNSWLDEAHAAAGVLSESTLLTSDVISPTLQGKLKADLNAQEKLIDPVLCQATLPDKIKARIIHQLPAETEVMVTSVFSSSTPTGFAVVKLSLDNQAWKISDITCSRGDVLEEREFTFEAKGQLLKNVPAPLDNSLWHLVFTENNEAGHTVALSLTPNSKCTIGEIVAMCDVEQFKEAMHAEVSGNMTDSGVEVVNLVVTNEAPASE